jgi:hypothetical protein
MPLSAATRKYRHRQHCPVMFDPAYNLLNAFTTRFAINASPLSEGCNPSYVISCASGGYGYSSAGLNGIGT